VSRALKRVAVCKHYAGDVFYIVRRSVFDYRVARSHHRVAQNSKVLVLYFYTFIQLLVYATLYAYKLF
jgi:hypothetical protein